MTTRIGDVLPTDIGSNRPEASKSTDTNLSTEASGYWNDYYVDTKMADLTNPQFRSWYCKAFYLLGKERIDGIAHTARKGRHPQRYFSLLLKQALAK